MKEVVSLLIEQGKTISTMESCTGGALASCITDVPNASQVISFSAVTYSNAFKIKMGVDENVIKKFSVYSLETAMEMSKNISFFANSSYGVGITGQINKKDTFNPTGEQDKIYVSIYDKERDCFYNEVIHAISGSRHKNKERIVRIVEEKLFHILNE